MPNHFEAIGFAVRDEDDLQELAAAAVEHGDVVPVRGGTYYHWAPGAGAEVWVQVVGRRWLGMTPHFAGETALGAGIVGRVRYEDDTPLEGCLHAWANPAADDPAAGEYPFVFAVPDFRVLDGMRMPAAAPVRVAAFAHEIDVHPSAEAFYAAQQTELKYAAESFIPSGMFGRGGELPVPLALINGTVMDAERRTNPAGTAFWWMRVRTLGGEVDVVAQTALVAAEPVPGGIVSGEFYLSGRVIADAPPPRRGWIRRLTGR
jgi:hypothetical protein